MTSLAQSDEKARTLLEIVLAQMTVSPHRIRRVLVVGCGNGKESTVLAELFDCPVTAIDIENTFEGTDPRVQFRRMDARQMQFNDGCFDFVYSYHALEHIRGAESAVKEIARVLADDGIYCIGTPNRSRLIGYIGSDDASWHQKISWNAYDYIARIRGRFTNECGAHAGFTATELLSLCGTIGPPTNISDSYFYNRYSRYASALSAIRLLKLQTFAWPSVYFCGYKSPSIE